MTTVASRRLASTLVALAALAACAPRPVETAPARTPPTARAAWTGFVDSLVSDRMFRSAHWGILVVDPVSRDTLYSRNAGKLFMPASNEKILTGATSLALLGPDFRFRTTLRTNGAIVYTAATCAIRRVWRFSPLVSRLAKVRCRVSAAACVAGRRSAWRIGTPLPSKVSTKTVLAGVVSASQSSRWAL